MKYNEYEVGRTKNYSKVKESEKAKAERRKKRREVRNGKRLDW